MIKEIRQISFFLDDVAMVLQAGAQYLKFQVPPESVSTISQDEEKKQILVGFEASEHEHQVIRYKYETVVAMIIYYCRLLNIPLPKRAHKTLKIYKDHIEVLIEYPVPEGAGWTFQSPSHEKA